jgi:RND superfamily putative drug exporter
VFAIFATLQVITFKQLGVGLAAAVLLDATLVRAVALPAVVSLLGERGWPVRRPTGRGPDRASAAGAPRWDDASVSTRSGVQ